MNFFKKSTVVMGLLLGLIIFLPGANADAATYEKKSLKIYNNSEDDVKNIDCVFRDDMPSVPYVNIEEFLEILYAGSDYKVDGAGNIFKIQGTAAGKVGSTMTVDTDKETISIDREQEFPVGTVSEVDADYVVQEMECPDGIKPVNYDLSKYNIDLYSESGKVYMPVSVAADVNPYSYSYMDYVDGSLYLARVDASLEVPEFIQTAEEKYLKTSLREQDETDYAYRELCFRLTDIYGYPERASSQEFVKRIEKSGLSGALDAGGTMDGIDIGKIKEYLTSTSKAKYAAGLMMLDCLLFDGGHTSLSLPFIGRVIGDYEQALQLTRDLLELCKTDPDTVSAMNDVMNISMRSGNYFEQVKETRKKIIGKPVKTWKSDGNTVASLYISENTAVFSFDSFIDDVITISSDIKPFNEALELAKKKGCVNFAIDLGANGGGSSAVVGYITAMISKDNSSTSYLLDRRSGTKLEVKSKADRNFDGVVDGKDLEISYDFNYAVMTTRCSFSCGNLMPAVAKEMGIPTVGERSGGGGCAVNVLGVPVNGGMFMLSGGSSTMCYSDYTSIDGGVPVNITLVSESQSGAIQADDMYDMYSLTRALNKQYGIALKANTMKVKVSTKKIKASKVSSKKVTVKNAIKVTKAQGAVAYKKMSGSKKLSVNKKGYIMVKKGTKAGTYKIKVRVSTDGTGCYKAKSTTKVVTVKVK